MILKYRTTKNNLRLITRLAGLILGLCLLLAVKAGAQDRLTIAGTGDSQEVLRSLAQAFEDVTPGVRVQVPDSIGSSGGIKSLIEGRCDLARIARPLKESERSTAPDLQVRFFARAPVVFAANLPQGCLDNLSSAQLVDIFSGKLANWSELGSCPAHKIYVALREEGDSSRSVIERIIPAFGDFPELVGKVIYSTPETAETIARTPFAIGYLPLSAITNAPVQVLAFNGIKPSDEHIGSGAYPLTTTYGLVWKGELTGSAATFIRFIDSPVGQRIIHRFGVVPLSAP